MYCQICQLIGVSEVATVNTLSGLHLCAKHANKPIPETMRPAKEPEAVDPEALPKAAAPAVADKAIKPTRNKTTR